MTTPDGSGPPRPQRRRIAERGGTRDELLETAGEIFAERGFQAATGKEICERASANSAAINYYFGSMEGLYQAVLDKAWYRLPNVDDYIEAAGQHADAAAKLRAVIELLVGALVGPASTAWAVRIVAREICDPSPLIERRFGLEGHRTFGFITSIVAEIMKLPPNDPAVMRGSVSALATPQLMLIVNPRLRERFFPDLAAGEAGVKAIVDHIVEFALGGLTNISRRRDHSPR
jgi:AcrR family transcriptional regulator